MTEFLIQFTFTALITVLFFGVLAYRMDRQIRQRSAARDRDHAEWLADFDRRAAEWRAEQEKAEAAWAARYAELLREAEQGADAAQTPDPRS